MVLLLQLPTALVLKDFLDGSIEIFNYLLAFTLILGAFANHQVVILLDLLEETQFGDAFSIYWLLALRAL